MIKTILSHDFRHTAINQLWRLISGPTILILIPLYLSSEAQGYWFTFISLAALAVFADLGFTTIILQFSAHEFAYLHFDDNEKLVGDPENLNRLSSLFHFALQWGVKASIVAFPVIFLVGYFILDQKQTNCSWLAPWSIYGIASMIIFVNNIVLSFIEGCNSVGNIQKIRFFISVINSMLIAFGLFFGFQLFALACALFVSSCMGKIIIFKKYGTMLKQLYNIKIEDRYNWKSSILPLIGKYAISWMSGYFIFSIFTPLAFHYYGAEEAGKIGLSIALWTAIFSIANIWMTIIIPKINVLIARGDYITLNPIFYKHLKLSVVTFIVGIMTVFLLYFLLDGRFEIVKRFVSPLSLFLLAICWLLQIIVNSIASYMRAHKEEPLVIPSLISGIYIALTTWILAVSLSSEYFFLGFLSSYIWGAPWVWIIFRKYQGRKFGSQ